MFSWVNKLILVCRFFVSSYSLTLSHLSCVCAYAMCAYMCVRVYIHVCIYVYLCVYMCVCLCVYMCVYVNEHCRDYYLNS